MQFRSVRGVVQVVAYNGYDKARRRAKVKLLGSFDRHTFEMTDTLKKNVTVEQMEEIQQRIEKMRQSVNMAVTQAWLDRFTDDAERAIPALWEGEARMDPAAAAAAAGVLGRLGRAFRAAAQAPEAPIQAEEREARRVAALDRLIASTAPRGEPAAVEPHQLDLEDVISAPPSVQAPIPSSEET